MNDVRRYDSKELHLAKRSSGDVAFFTGDHIMRGYWFSTFKVSPFTYDASTRSLYFVPEVRITMPVGSVKLKARASWNHFDTDNADIREMVINADEMDSLYQRAPRVLMQAATSGEQVDYLIVTSNALKSSFANLRNWKVRRGIRTKIITVEEIYNTYSGATNQIKIKRCLQDYYQNHGLKWALLGGAPSVIPAQMCYIKYVSTSETHIGHYARRSVLCVL